MSRCFRYLTSALATRWATIRPSKGTPRSCRETPERATGVRGQPNTKVRHNLLHLTLDVPDSDVLLNWAATPHKPLAGQVVFYSATQLVALETIAFTAGACVGYHEQFESGASGDGAYVCQLTITAPAFELRAGGAPAAVAVVAAVTKASRKIEGTGGAGSSAAPPPAGENAQPPMLNTRRFKSDGSNEENAPQPGAPRAITDATVLAKIGTTLHALRQLLSVRHAELTKWDAPAQAYFQQAFGSTTKSAHDTILTRITNIQLLSLNYETDDAYKHCFLEVDDDDEPGSVAETYSDDAAHKRYLYNLFWQMPTTGTDSQPGVLAHEMSHFEDMGLTKDHAYGIDLCALLAVDDSARLYGQLAQP